MPRSGEKPCTTACAGSVRCRAPWWGDLSDIYDTMGGLQTSHRIWTREVVNPGDHTI